MSPPREPAAPLVALVALSLVCGMALAMGLAEVEREADAAHDLAARCIDGWSEDRARLEACVGVADACRDVLLGGACACWIPGDE